MQLQSLKLLRPMVKVRVQVQETARTNVHAQAWVDSDRLTLVQN